MKRILVFCGLTIALAASAQAQQKRTKAERPGGSLMLGLRTTSSLFTDAGSPGMGVGGQFRIRLLNKVNTDWFADYITTDLDGLGKRTDGHIGWSVLFYFRPPEQAQVEGDKLHKWPRPISCHRFTPYLLAGHCFDYTQITSFTGPELLTIDRWSSAVQAGAGVHWNLFRFTDLSATAQYMLHLGSDLHTHIHNDGGIRHLEVEQHSGRSPEGHLLITLSMNFRIADLW